MWTAGKKYSPPSFATDRPTRFKIDSTDNDVATESKVKRMLFAAARSERRRRNAHHPPFLFAREMFSISFRIIVHSVSLCRVLCGE